MSSFGGLLAAITGLLVALNASGVLPVKVAPVGTPSPSAATPPASTPPPSAATTAPAGLTSAPEQAVAAELVRKYYRLWNLGEFRTMYGMLSARMQRDNPYEKWAQAHSLVTQIVVGTTPRNSPFVVDVHVVSHDREADGTTSRSVYDGQWYLTKENGDLKLDVAVLHKATGPP